MTSSGVDIVATPSGDHHVRVVGSGPPMLVLPGGPGWGAKYMFEPLVEQVGNGRRLIFVDQRGTGDSPVGNGPLTMSAG